MLKEGINELSMDVRAYIAIHKGRKLGVFEDASEALEQLIHYPGAVWKASFWTYEEASNFVKNGP